MEQDLGSPFGCEWGRRVGLPWDHDPCVKRAVRDVVLHDPHNVLGGQERWIRLCGEHFEVLLEETDPHQAMAA